MNIKNLKDNELISLAKSKAITERSLSIEVINLIGEIDQRKLYLSLGFGSLFDFVRKELGYEESAALRRIQAARLIREIPEVRNKFDENTLSLTNASMAQSFFRREEKTSGQKIPVADKKAVLEKLESKSTREAERTLVGIFPDSKPAKREKVREVSNDLTQINISVDRDLRNKLEKLKCHLSHKNPNLSYAELLSELADIALTKFENKKKGKALNKNQIPETEVAFAKVDGKPKNKLANNLPSAPKVRSRYIEASTRRAVWNRDNGCCSYKNSETGRKCESKFQVEVHHIKPFTFGGENSLENLALLCRAHNNYFARRDFGIEKMNQYKGL